MCILTAQARTKCLPWNTGPAFSLQISTRNASYHMSMCISPARARAKRWGTFAVDLSIAVYR